MEELYIPWSIFGVWRLMTGDTSISTAPSRKLNNISHIVQLTFKDTSVVLLTCSEKEMKNARGCVRK
jgi:hypothetical protein